MRHLPVGLAPDPVRAVVCLDDPVHTQKGTRTSVVDSQADRHKLLVGSKIVSGSRGRSPATCLQHLNP